MAVLRGHVHSFFCNGFLSLTQRHVVEILIIQRVTQATTQVLYILIK